MRRMERVAKRVLAVMALAVGLSGLAGASADARYITAAALLDWCRDDGSTFCPGYLAALADYQSVLQSLDTPTQRFCLPSNVKLAVLREVVLDQLGRQAPAALNALAPTVMVTALARRFPAPADDADCLQRAAAYVDGDEFITWCEDDSSRFCAGYLAGLVDYQDELRRLDVATPRFCLPEDTTLSQLHRLALDRLRANPPRERKKLAASLVIPAFFRRFPCG